MCFCIVLIKKLHHYTPEELGTYYVMGWGVREYPLTTSAAGITIYNRTLRH